MLLGITRYIVYTRSLAIFTFLLIWRISMDKKKKYRIHGQILYNIMSSQSISWLIDPRRYNSYDSHNVYKCYYNNTFNDE